MARWVNECLAWVLAVGHHWETLVTGGIVTALLTTLQYKKQKSIPWTLARRVFAGFLFIAFFLAWRDQYERAETAEARALRAETTLSAKGQEAPPKKGPQLVITCD